MDPDELQLLDEKDQEWVNLWKNALKHREELEMAISPSGENQPREIVQPSAPNKIP
jgi:hypothetical protein